MEDRGIDLGSSLTDGEDESIVLSSLVETCSALELRMVAEGIETISEFDAIQESGAQYGQGFLLARPAFPIPRVTWPHAPNGV